MKAIFRPLVVASLIAAVINQILYFVATEAFGQEFLLAQGEPMAIPFFAPAMFSIFQGIVGGVLGDGSRHAPNHPATCGCRSA